jgi:DNA-binding FadR family transcriptional regulator
MPVVSSDAPQPPYLQIAADLRRRIHTGEISVGERLHSSRELMSDYGVASMTVHQAIKVLRDEGLVVSHPGRGVYVADDALTAAVGSDDDEAGDVSTQIGQLRAQLEAAAQSTDVADLQGEVQELRRQLGRLEGHLIDLYARVGQTYPHERQEPQGSAELRRRRAGNE